MRFSLTSCFLVKYFDVWIEHWYELAFSSLDPPLCDVCEPDEQQEQELPHDLLSDSEPSPPLDSVRALSCG